MDQLYQHNAELKKEVEVITHIAQRPELLGLKLVEKEMPCRKSWTHIRQGRKRGRRS